MKNVDVLFINPYWSKLGESIEHMGFAYMASALRKSGFAVSIEDAPINGWDNIKTIEGIKEYSPLLIGVSIPFQEGAADALEFIQMLRHEFNSHITVGGIYPTFEYESMMNEYNEIDSIILGEGEETIVDLIYSLKNQLPLSSVDGLAIRSVNKIITTKKRPLVEDLDSLTYPSRDTLPQVMEKFNFASIVSSRGCYGRCSFCSVDGFYSEFGSKYRYRSSQNVVDEMERLLLDSGVHNFMFNDANFIGGLGRGKERAFEIGSEILKRNIKCEFRIQCRANDVDYDLFKLLKEAGLSRVYVGIESGSQSQLDRYIKDITVEQNLKALSILNELGLFAKLGFIMFDREATVDDLMNNISFINKVKKLYDKNSLGYIYPVSMLMPLAGSAEMKKMKEAGALKGSYKGYTYKFKDKKVALLYSMMKRSASTIWGIKSKVKSNEDDTMDWTRGWKIWDDNKHA